MSNRYVLIDYENIQPKTLERVDPERHTIVVFVGPNQKNMPISLVTAMQRFEYRCVQAAGSGRNALDLHIAFFIGCTAAAEPDASFHVVSKDKGFDPLIKYLTTEKITVRRVESIDRIAEMKAQNSRASAKAIASIPDRIAFITNNLRRRSKALPGNVGKLETVIRELFQKKLKDEDVTRLVDQLKERGTVTVQGTKVSYQL